MFKLLIILILCKISYQKGTPIIGILTQEYYSWDDHFTDKPFKSYVPASYIKFLESAGARVVPIWIGQSKEYYERVVNYTNGLLFPGGTAVFDREEGCSEAAKHLYDAAVELNKRKIRYPILGICQGFQLFGFVSAGKDIRVQCEAHKVSFPLRFLDGYKNSNLFWRASDYLLDMLKTQNVTYNYHQYCLTRDSLKKANISQDWKLLAMNEDVNGVVFISAMESTKYRFYGVIYHPEKNIYEFNEDFDIPHSTVSIEVSRYIAEVFVFDSRLNNNAFPNKSMEHKALIYNYCPVFTAPLNSAYNQVYVFTEEDFQNNQLLP